MNREVFKISVALFYVFLALILILVLLACAAQAVIDGVPIWTVIFQ